MMMIIVSSAMAQITTSGLNGKVTLKATGEEVLGATVQAVHTPSGTKYNAITNSNGLYAIQGMRAGGPYEITISYIGAQTTVIKDVRLQLAEISVVDAQLVDDATQLGEVIVVASASKFSAAKTGAATNISSAQIESMPTVNRSLTEFTRLSPYGGNGMSFGGADGRTANFTIDGANFNNDFGLNASLPGGGNPISIDAIEEMQVVISPFDVRQTNFIGGGVNAITKSGTNKFHGSAFVYHKNENMQGDAVDRVQIPNAREKSSRTTYGMTFGGPILKDKLFFFVNGEMEITPTVANRWRGTENGVANAETYQSRTTIADLQRVSDHVAQKYGYNTGSFTKFPADEKNYKLLARLDWNINDMHHLALRYNYTMNRAWNSPNATSMDGGPRMSGARMSQYSMSYANSMYGVDNILHNFSVDLNSRLSDNLSNQLLATYKKGDDVRSSNSSEFPFIDILKDDQNYISLGYELFTWNNAVHNTVWNVKDDLTYYIGKHKIFGGVSFEHTMADNAYMRNGTGYYRYNSVDDFIQGLAPQVFCLTYGYDGETNPAARVQHNKVSVYAQDDWNVTDRFRLTYGLRWDGLFFSNSDLMRNQAIYDIDYNGRHIDTGKWPSANMIFSPRVGFTWDVLGDKSLKVRGGTGIFAGRLPLVFFTNMPTNGGMVQYQCQIGPSTKYANMPDAVKAQYSSVAEVLNQFSGGVMTNISDMLGRLAQMGYPMTVRPEDGTVPSAISATDSKFKLPQVWKTSVAVDYSIPVSFPFNVTGEVIYNKNIYDNCISDWAIPSVEGFARFNGVDNRPIYPTGFRTATKAFVLENTSKGYSVTASLSANARPTDWLSLMAAYTYTKRMELTSLPGSAAESAFTYVPTVEGPNHIKLHNGINAIPHRIVASATAHDKSGNHWSIIYEATKGGNNYSYMMTNDMNGDGYNYDAIYVPTDEQVANKQFRFASADDAQRFMAFVHNDDYLSSHQGEYAEAYSVYTPWLHRIDFSYKHDFKIYNNHQLTLSLDVKNVLNLFDSSWGVAKTLNPAIGSEARILNYDGVDADGYAVYSTPKAINGETKTWTPNHSLGQCWYASIGVRYSF